MEVSIHLCLPQYGGLVYNAFEQARAQADREGMFSMESRIGDSLVSRARNVLTQTFLDGPCTHMMFIDADIVFSTQDVAKLVEAAKGGADVVGGLYPLKRKELQWCANFIEGEKANDAGLMRVKYIGTGFMLVSRRAINRLIAAHPELEYVSDANEGLTERNGRIPRTLYNLWTVGVYNRRLLSEDWFFCQHCEDLGIPVYAHTGVKLRHIGLIAYPLEDPK